MKVEARYTVDGIHIRDKSGRIVLFRGCNLGGDSKIPAVPVGNPLTCDVSFTGRPFPEAEADEHFSRLAGWGFTFLRFVITWEAVEHSGPGLYDEDYLAYLRNILKKAGEHGISVFIDPHQDVWSRWTGGDGAPGWTLEAVGFDLAKIAPSGSAFTSSSKGAAYRQMEWGFNYLRYANATMWTLFFGGNTFAPGRYVEGVPVQDWLQDHFIDAMNHTARRLKDCDAIVGFGTLNEPHYGYIGLPSLNKHHRITAPSGLVPTAFQSMAAASGFPQKVKRVALAGAVTMPGGGILNPEGISIFRDGFACPWREAGVWALENGVPVVKKDDWFLQSPEWARNAGLAGPAAGSAAGPADRTDSARGIAGNGRGSAELGSFTEYFLKPFQKKFMDVLSKKHASYLFFVEGIPHAHRASWTAEDRLGSDGKPLSIVEAFHWYEGIMHLTKKWHSWLIVDSETSALSVGPGSARRSVRRQLGRLAMRPRSEGIPAFLGEFGVPMDLSNGASYRSGDYSAQETAFGVYYDAIDALLLHSTVWNYTVSNTHEKGDGWNTEDFSIYSASTGGGRAERGFSRPYAMAVAGVPAAMRFDAKKRVFFFEWDAADGVTDIYVPAHWYPEGWRSSFAGGDAELEENPGTQRLLVTVSGGGRVSVKVYPLGED